MLTNVEQPHKIFQVFVVHILIIIIVKVIQMRKKNIPVITLNSINIIKKPKNHCIQECRKRIFKENTNKQQGEKSNSNNDRSVEKI